MTTKLFAVLIAAGIGFASHAATQPSLPYPDIVDTTHTSKDAADFFRVFFSAKSLHRPAELMEHLTAAYDNSLFDDPTYQALVPLAAEQ